MKNDRPSLTRITLSGGRRAQSRLYQAHPQPTPLRHRPSIILVGAILMLPLWVLAWIYRQITGRGWS